MSATAPGYMERLWNNFQVLCALGAFCGWGGEGRWPQQCCIKLVFLSVCFSVTCCCVFALSDLWISAHYGLHCWQSLLAYGIHLSLFTCCHSFYFFLRRNLFSLTGMFGNSIIRNLKIIHRKQQFHRRYLSLSLATLGSDSHLLSEETSWFKTVLSYSLLTGPPPVRKKHGDALLGKAVR